MTPRRIGFPLLCAFLFCAFAAQDALGTTAAQNTTIVFCSFGGGAKDFTDAHCDKQGQGKFGHSEFPVAQREVADGTSVAGMTFKGTIFGVKSEITCKTFSGSGEVVNEEPQAKVHQLKIPLWLFGGSGCTVNKPALGCKVKEPIEFNLKAEGVEGLGAGKNEMGLEFKPKEGETFGEITIEGCIIKGTYKVTGTAIGTGTPAPTAKFSGATSVFTNAMTKETLKLAGNPAEISSTITFQAQDSELPLAFTTTT